MAAWAADLQQRFGGRPIALALEQKRGAVVYMLLKYAHLVLYPVPPGMSASYRQAFFPAGTKDDPGDTALLLDLLLRHRERLHPGSRIHRRLDSSSSWWKTASTW